MCGTKSLLSEQDLTIALVAGELSGDNLGAPLILAIKQVYPKAKFVGIGGPQMIAAGLESWTDIEDLSVNGFVDPIRRLPSLLRILLGTRDRITQIAPDCFIGIDFNFFNGLLEGMVKKRGMKTVHYVSPSVWAWRRGRIKSLRRNLDLMLTLYPFETQIYRDNGINVEFVGHPKADEISEVQRIDAKAEARKKLDLRFEAAIQVPPVIAMLPGSRGSEVKLSAPGFLMAAQIISEQKPGSCFIIPAANQKRHAQMARLIKQHAPQLHIKLVMGESQTAMLAADAVLVNSGTATLEAMLLRRPMVMSYRLGSLTYAVVSRIVSIKHFALPNILANEKIVPEYLQSNATPEALANALLELLEDNEHPELMKRFARIHADLKRSSGEVAARAILTLCDKRVV
ncbi:lipid-A-disaccharide synthase [Pseudomonadales bacterium]|jgi:lipid-A-disaccharide synthase|nr:lipid-A-disaccharide synthase [Pseudomonadales bacterium]|tara:strand:+ start:1246 stop:2445 length:1200 start_codon:yes stop_codon:yes gene_type:complete